MSFLKRFDGRPILQNVAISFFLNLIIEILSRRSIAEGLGFFISQPWLFLYNAAIIMFTLAIVPAFRRRYFAQILISALWLVLGLVNFVLLSFRTTPLAATDFILLMSVDGILSKYLNLFEIILIVVAAVGLLIGMVIALYKTPKCKPKYLTVLAGLLVATVCIAGLQPFLLKEQVLTSDFGNLAEAYNEYGFAYCFYRSIVDRGIDRPEDYSPEKIQQLLRAIGAGEDRTPEMCPNIVMVQLESFFDVNYLKGVSFSENPVPVFSRLKESCPHGLLTVPSIGAGTANTEFEILTGMSLNFFGAGEYPYKTVLQKNTCESICYSLAELGYTSHAIHNHQGTFYERHVVFPNLGFDTFTSLEFMEDVDFNPQGWARDEVLTGEILKALASSVGSDFVYAISVQAHGKYPETVGDEPRQIVVSGLEGEGERAALEYYVNQLRETDAFIDALLAELDQWDEPVVLVLFGDHLPGLDIENEDLGNGDRYQTEYIIWSNYGLEVKDRDLCAYQLGAHVLKQLGIDAGLLAKLHQTMENHENYLEALEMLEYDLISGAQIAYGERGPHPPTDMRMGITEIQITGILPMGDRLVISGAGYTEWSQVYINDRAVDTDFIDAVTLVISAEDAAPGDDIVVAQVGDDTILAESAVFSWR
jgi:phosphoglycerol transferase MdoB-like AlkP superfamily enzyme